MGIFTSSPEEIQAEIASQAEEAVRLVETLRRLPKNTVILKTEGEWQIIGAFGIAKKSSLLEALLLFGDLYGKEF